MAERSWSVERDTTLQVCAACPDSVYLQLKVPDEVHRVTKIRFTMISHDQGWSDTPHLKGGYVGCMSSFYATVLNENGHDRLRPRVIQHNRHAIAEPWQHQVAWNITTTDADPQSWMSAIRAGDTIQILAIAEFRGWLNYVHYAKIEISGLLNDHTFNGANVISSQVHRPLNSAAQEFRLLELLPGSGEEPVCCILRHTVIGDCPYQCLSYAWGEQSSHTEIQLQYQDAASDGEPCDYTPFRVTPNLHSALRHLRPEAGSSRTMWIDAICINQSNLTERSEQVSLMREIYSRADMVVVWLGDGGLKMTEIVNHAIEIARRVILLHKDIDKDSDLYRNMKQMHETAVKAGGREIAWTDRIFGILENDWFSRLWVVPEAYRARSITAQLGSSTIPWRFLLRIHRCVNSVARGGFKHRTDRKMLLPGIFSFLFQDDAQTDDIFGFANASKPKPRDVLGLLIRAIDLDCSDPRDKVFAILDLAAEDAMKADAAVGRLVQPDYRKSVVRVFADLTRWWIIRNRSLRILSAVHVSLGRTWQPQTLQGRLAPGRPSWCFWFDGRSAWSKATLGIWNKGGYNAMGSTVVDIELLQAETDDLRLRLTGRLLSRITRITTFPYVDLLAKRQAQDLVAAYDKLYSPQHGRPWKSWASSDDLDGDEGAGLGSSDPYAHLLAHKDYAMRNKGALPCHPACFMTLQNGSRGLCPPMAQPGDCVVALHGGAVPYILREQPEVAGFGFVAKCYIEGYMYSEVTIGGASDTAE